jgi:hypothetical protein
MTSETTSVESGTISVDPSGVGAEALNDPSDDTPSVGWSNDGSGARRMVGASTRSRAGVANDW